MTFAQPLSASSAPAAPDVIGDLEALERQLDSLELGSGNITASKIGTGSSNITIMLERGGDRMVLRRPPLPPLPAGAHDVLREARLQDALFRLGIPVPRVLASVDLPNSVGAPFYLMEFRDGYVVADELPSGLEDRGSRFAAIEALVAALADLHSISPGDPLLRPFVRRGDYLRRQIARFAGNWAQARRRVPGVDRAHEWLETNVPDAGPLAPVHGDFRLGNVMLNRRTPTQIDAVLDWEMGAIGDPRADLGYLLATYSHPASRRTPLELSPVTRDEGFPSPEEIIAIYERCIGGSVGDLRWFEALAYWKGAIFSEAIYERYQRGLLADDPFAATLAEGVPALAEAACEVAFAGHG